MMLLLGKLERYLYLLFPVLYVSIILPADNPANVFAFPKTAALFIFIILVSVAGLTNNKHLTIKQLLVSFFDKPRYVFWLIGFATFIGLTSFLSEFPGQAWFGEPTLQTGTIFLILLCLLFIFYSNNRHNVRKSLIFLLLFINIISVIEYLGFRPLEFIVNKNFTLTSPFPAATVGIRTHLSAITLMLLLLPLYWFKGRYNDWKFWFILIIAAIGFGCTITSSSLIGLFCSLCLFSLIMRRRIKMAILIILVITLSSNMYRPLQVISREFQDYGWVKVVGESKDLSSTTTMSTRLILWQAALKMIEEKPIFGWGNSTYNQIWYKFISKDDGDRLFRLELGLQPFQKMSRINDYASYRNLNNQIVPVHLDYTAPHNAFLDLVYSQGIVGLCILCGFILSIFRYFYKKLGNTALLAFLPILGYSIYLLAWFVTVPATGLAAIILGIQVAELRKLEACLKIVHEVT